METWGSKEMFFRGWILFLLIFGFWKGILYPNPFLEIHFIHVGHGDAIWVKLPNSRNLLIDTGNLSQGSVVADYLKNEGVKKIDHLIITHPHPDHLGGFFVLDSQLEIDKIYGNGLPLDDEVFQEFQHVLQQTGRSVIVIRKNDEIREGDAIFSVLHSGPEMDLTDVNDCSLVLRLKYHSFSALFAGDILSRGQEVLAKQIPDLLKSDLLKVPHHASKDAYYPPFFKLVSPGVSVVTVGPNPYNYPSEETLWRLKEVSGKVYRTDRDGTIVVRVSPDQPYKVTTRK